MKCRLCLLLMFALRGLERLLPPRLLYGILQPLARLRVALKPAPASAALPGYFQKTVTAQDRQRHWVNVNLAYWMASFPDRLASAKWQPHCRIFGLDSVYKARQKGRPVVLAFFHCGPSFLLPQWLRAAGIPVVTLRIGKAQSRSPFKRVRDKFTLFPHLPVVLYLDQLREVMASLTAGNVLLIALDHVTGRPVDVPLNEEWTFHMATGAMRLAARHQADLIPCCLIDEGNWRFRVELGRPVPAEHLTENPNLAQAGKHLLTEMLPHLQSHPEQCNAGFFQCFRRHAPVVSLERSCP